MDVLSTSMSAELLGTPAWLWLVLLAWVAAALALDLGVLRGRGRSGEVGVRAGLVHTGIQLALGLGFGAVVWWCLGGEGGQQYLTGYLIGRTLAMDDAFVIAMIFTFLGVPREYQHRVLFWGILAVLASRAMVLGLGVTLVTQFPWVLHLLAAILVATGLRMLLFVQGDFDVANSSVLRALRSRLRVTDAPHGDRFWVRLPAPRREAAGAARAWWATPSLLALALIACAYLVCAMDSLPAILVITQDPFVACASGLFGVLGLRALYFALAALIHRFRPLRHALAIALLMVGAQGLARDLLGTLPAWPVLAATIALLLGAPLYSRYRAARRAPAIALRGQEAG
jgi:tellurite resistance protein TerC